MAQRKGGKVSKKRFGYTPKEDREEINAIRKYYQPDMYSKEGKRALGKKST